MVVYRAGSLYVDTTISMGLGTDSAVLDARLAQPLTPGLDQEVDEDQEESRGRSETEAGDVEGDHRVHYGVCDADRAGITASPNGADVTAER